MRATIAALMAVALLPLATAAAVLEVPGQYSTIRSALVVAGSGDEVVVAPGTYAPSTNGESFPLSVPDGVTLRSAGGGETILDAEGTLGVLVLSGTGTARVTGLTLTGGNAIRGGGVRITAGSHEVDHNRILACGALKRGSAVSIEGTSTPWVHHNVAWECFDTDLQEPGDPHVFQSGENSAGLVEHNLVGRGDSNGYFIFENAGPTVRHNIFVGNGIDGFRGRGICFDGDAATVIAHNLFFDNSISSLVMRDPSGSFVNVDAQTANDFFISDGVFGNLDGDPLLANPEAGDFRLLPGSPAIDAGDPSLPGDPDGSVADLGPLPFDPTVAAPIARPAQVRLLQNAPNPFNPRTIVPVDVATNTVGSLDVFDSRGRHVRVLHRGPLGQGRTDFVFDGLSDRGASLSSGVYHLRLLTPLGSETRKITLVR